MKELPNISDAEKDRLKSRGETFVCKALKLSEMDKAAWDVSEIFYYNVNAILSFISLFRSKRRRSWNPFPKTC